ncbi:DUF6266 family protein [Daejeonella sp.]|uniref:DUF6266 family protein n=1 Tax=Daejeonella sp. TaxID=2805397 RepID=UPI0039833F91
MALHPASSEVLLAAAGGGYIISKDCRKRARKNAVIQIQQQKKFAFAVRFLKYVKQVVDLGYSRINAGGATGYNMAISYIVQNCVKGMHPNFEIDYSSVVFCTKGKLSLPETITKELDGMNLKMTWSVESNIYSSATNKVELLIYQPGLGCYQIAPDGITRGDGGMEIELDTWYKGDTVHVYMFLSTSSSWVKKE